MWYIAARSSVPVVVAAQAFTDSRERKSPRHTPIPTATTPNSLLALLWDDLDPTDYDNPGAHVYFHSNSDRCVIQFADYPEYRADPGDVIDMEVILYKDGRIRYQYGDIMVQPQDV